MLGVKSVPFEFGLGNTDTLELQIEAIEDGETMKGRFCFIYSSHLFQVLI